MNPINPNDPPRNLGEDFNIIWRELLVSGTTYKSEAAFEYLREIKKYCNNGGIPRGIVAKCFHYRHDREFERLLDVVHKLPLLQQDFIPILFTETGIADHLKEFAPDRASIAQQIRNAEFNYLNSFDIEAVLARYLYNYGMYDHFYSNNPASRAIEISREFTQMLYQADPENVVCFTSMRPWGKWFDVHSCSDHTFVLVNKARELIWLFCFSHSD